MPICRRRLMSFEKLSSQSRAGKWTSRLVHARSIAN